MPAAAASCWARLWISARAFSVSAQALSVSARASSVSARAFSVSARAFSVSAQAFSVSAQPFSASAFSASTPAVTAGAESGNRFQPALQVLFGLRQWQLSIPLPSHPHRRIARQPGRALGLRL